MCLGDRRRLIVGSAGARCAPAVPVLFALLRVRIYYSLYGSFLWLVSVIVRLFRRFIVCFGVAWVVHYNTQLCIAAASLSTSGLVSDG